MYDKCYFCLDQLPKLKKESTASFFVNFGRSRGTKEPTYITVIREQIPIQIQILGFVSWSLIGFTRCHDIWYPRGILTGQFLPAFDIAYFLKIKQGWFSFTRNLLCFLQHPEQIVGIGFGIVFVWKDGFANWAQYQTILKSLWGGRASAIRWIFSKL